jgi:hypothetical protein
MYGPRLCKEYMDGVHAFIENAKKDMVDNDRQYLYFPCKNCKIEKRYLQEDVLIKRGINTVKKDLMKQRVGIPMWRGRSLPCRRRGRRCG